MISKIKKYVSKRFKSFGINKHREVSRLLYEISKRENTSFLKIAKDIKGKHYSIIKDDLISRRYPGAKAAGAKIRAYLPELNPDSENTTDLNKKFSLYPEKVFVEKAAHGDYLSCRMKELFPKASFIYIESLKNYTAAKTQDLKDYNKRRANFFVIREKYDFFKKCPCTDNAISCGYKVLNLGLGCVYECVYCYLQGYLNNPGGIVIPSNIEDFFRRFKTTFGKNNSPNLVKIGSGEFTDSLALDEITGFSRPLIDFFKCIPGVYFEFKTKSKNVANILNSKPSKNIVISWSLNPPKIIKDNEFYTAGLEERISSAVACAKAGFKVGFHFDPIIYYQGWEKDYRNLVNYSFDNVSSGSIAWISLGTLRFNPGLKKIIENRFPKNKILDEELLLGFDEKLRYSPYLRIMMYKKMLSWIKKRAPGVHIYLCMEERKIWEETYGP